MLALFFGQTFAANDIALIGSLVVLEALLSADNALVLAILVRHLGKVEQKKALMYGLLGAFILRAAAILLAAYIISFWWLQAIGAGYLLYLPIKHFIQVARGGHEATGKPMGFWATVVYLNLVDLAFALDSVIVAVAIVNAPDKIWVVIAGAVIGIILLRFAASYFIRLLERYPALDHVAYLLVGWAGAKLLLISGHSFEAWYVKNQGQKLPFHIPEMPSSVFWVGMGVIAIGGTIFAVKHARKGALPDESQAKEVEELFSN